MRTGYTLNGRYRIIRALGEGGMANVYLAHDLILDRDVSVKLLRLDLRDDPSTVRRFQREALAATELLHPNIVQVYDVGEENGMQYLVMEYVQGTDLKAYIKTHFPIAYQEVIEIMEQILSAVKLAHEHNIIHRDLKPQNILIDPQRVAKITDFGIAVTLSEHSLTQTNTVLGSVHYLSPEQARGGMATKQSDIYSLGIILYEMLTGTVPFEGETAVSIALKHFQSEIPSVRAVDAQIPQALENVVFKATAKRPQDRYPDVAAMATDLQTALSPSRAGEERFNPAGDDDGETKVLPLSALSELTAADQPVKAAVTDAAAPEPANTTSEKAADKAKGRYRKRHPRRFRFIWAAVILFFLLVGILIGVALFRPQMTSVPNVVDRQQTSAQTTLTAAHLKVGEVHHTASAKVKLHRIIRTEPRSGTQLKRNTAVDLWISTGPQRYKLNDYKGDAYASTAAKLQALGFKVHRESVHSTSVPAGRIMQQSVSAGQKVIPKDTAITFTVSTGSQTVTLSDLTDKTKTQAQNYAAGHNLNLAFRYAYSNDVDKGKVIRQSPGEGAVVQEGDEITLTLSRGPESKGPETDQFNVRVRIPFDSSSSSTSDTASDDSSAVASSATENLIQIYLKDQDHQLSSIYKQMTITSDATVTLPFTVASGKAGAYKIVRNGTVIAEDKHVTKD
ncbi:Stk1 family PASTA domain-containing Ser/Thr kinase [Levilactobacillus acidifarinae]|uniref:non-specific serine/threonine protein kinase n=1 Tax=Levilactobacillus acidifarinae DSM 19394 = JCM 15949 TaxID=1423715 RepID=A0A0R1LG14_9LACO|nr:Stk1 family PASTA domain-containing Ser/Thr kinase [Levilactobacillus acidifarinae]KRK94360.1 serine threonine kinase [Levilactobacillus acidifarinae DSM 19394]GEO68100.1 protein kinase [Levilactobacillus acidifarinae]